MDAARLKLIQEIAERANDYSRVAMEEALLDLLPEMPRWIAVTPSTMPDIGTEVLVMDRGRKDLGPDIVVIVVRNVINAANNADYNDFSLRHYTHWMPLPAAPEGEKETK